MQVEVTAITSRVSSDGHPFCEVFYEVLTEGSHTDTLHHYCSRLWYPLADTPHARAAERAAFIRRQQKEPGR